MRQRTLVSATLALAVVFSGCGGTASHHHSASAGASGLSGATGLVGATGPSGPPDIRPNYASGHQAEDTVRRFYQRLNWGEFRRAWDSLPASVQVASGGFLNWHHGYATTVSSTPFGLRAESFGQSARVHLGLIAKDEDACSGRRTIQIFSGYWSLRLIGGHWEPTGIVLHHDSGSPPRTHLADCPLPKVPGAGVGTHLPPAPAPPIASAPTTDNFDEGNGYIVTCADGTLSHSGGIQGACSWHGGVAGP